jgi:hypothetical protein
MLIFCVYVVCSHVHQVPWSVIILHDDTSGVHRQNILPVIAATPPQVLAIVHLISSFVSMCMCVYVWHDTHERVSPAAIYGFL